MASRKFPLTRRITIRPSRFSIAPRRKRKRSTLAFSARYFEARCLESLNRKDEARDIYQQVIEVEDPNPYRDDSRLAVGSIFLEKGRKTDALRSSKRSLAKQTKRRLKPRRQCAPARSHSISPNRRKANPTKP